MFNKTISKVSRAIRSNTVPVFHDVASKISESSTVSKLKREDPVVVRFRELTENTIKAHKAKNSK